MNIPALKINIKEFENWRIVILLKIVNCKLKINPKRALAVLLAFLVLVPSIFLVFRPQKASADWLDDSYAYRQTISFTHNADLTNASMRLTVSNTNTLVTAGKMQSDCDDSRFADSNGKVLRFKLVSGCNSISTVYDVIFPTVINGNNLAYFYYGNPSAVSKSDSTVPTGTTPSGTPSFATEEKAPSPALSLKFDEGTGTTTQDSSSNNNDGAISGASWKTQESCLSNNCLFFDGSNDVVTVTNSDSIDLDRHLASAFTIDTWVRVNSDGEGNLGQIFSKGASTYFRIANEGTDGKADLQASLDLATTDATITITDGIELNKWTHISMSYTDDGDDEITIYINGTNRGSSTNGVGAPASDSNNLLIGGTTTANFHGFIDEFKIYPFERTASQIKTSAASKIPSVHGISASFGDDASYLSNGLVGYWKMDDGVNNPCASGVDKACDSSGNGNVGTWTGGTASTSGKFGNATTYDGVNDSLNLPDIYGALSSVTLCAWFNTPNVAVAGSTYPQIAGQDWSMLLSLDTNNVVFYINNGTTQVTSYASITGRNNQWIHACGVYDGANAKIYIDGIFIGQSAITGSLANYSSSFTIGSLGGTSRFFNGKIDDVRIYNRALSPSEVTRLYDWAPGPVGWWKMDENTGLTANDSSGNGNTGTLPFPLPSALSGWSYMTPLTITNSGSTLTDYQASVSANTSTPIAAGKMQPNCDDVRFYDSDNTTPLNYWYESNCNNPTTGAVFWVKIPSIPTGNKTIYMYYGNSSATTGSNGANTFYHFFDKNSTTGWSLSNITVTTSGDFLRFYNSNNSTTGTAQRYDLTLPSIYIMETQFKNTSLGTRDETLFILGQDSLSKRKSMAMIPLDSYNTYWGYYENSPNIIGSYTEGTEYIYKQINDDANSSTGSNYYLYNTSGSLLSSATGKNVSYGAPTDTNGIFIGDASTNTYTDFNIRWIRFRQYTATEPTVAPGSETIAGYPPSWTRGKFGSALNFDGVDDYVEFPNQTYYRELNGSDLTACLWQKTSTTYGANSTQLIGAYSTLTGSAPTQNQSWLLDNVNDKPRAFLRRDNNAEFISVAGNTILNDNQWHFLCFMKSGLEISVWADGKKENSSNLTQDGSTANDQPLRAGVHYGRHFKGSLDDVRIYNYARTAKQIVSDMNAGHPPVGSPVGSAIGHWKFDEGYGPTAHSSGSCATCSGTLTGMDSPATYGSGWTSNGKFGKALNFDGTDDQVVVSDPASNPFNLGTSNFTLSTWIKTTGVSQGIIAKQVPGTGGSFNGFYLQVDANGKLVGVVDWSTNSTYGYITGSTTVNDGTWKHVVLVINGADRTNWKIYINGNSDSFTEEGSDLTGSGISNSTSLRIGNRDYAGSYFKGAIDEVRVYNYALNANEIKVEYNQGKAAVWGAVSTNPDGSATNSAARAYCPPGNNETNCAGTGVLNPAPIGEWKMDENTGLTASDSSGFANHGIVALATGGTVTYSGGYTIHTFTGNGTFTPTFSGNIEVLIVGGGGGGGRGAVGSTYGGGGGAGGYLEGTMSITPGSYGVTVGSGGPAQTTINTAGNSGSDSVFNSCTAVGGGGGAGGGIPTGGKNGGSGGGGAYSGSSSGTSGGSATQGNCGTLTGYGNRGGDGAFDAIAGGGGGAGGVGTNGGGSGGAGGVGKNSTISGNSVTYATGGTGLFGATGGANTGNGGGGGDSSGAAGGSGIVIVRYLTTSTTSSSSPPTWTRGKIGSALKFDGVDDFVYMSNSSSLTPTNQITVEAWVKASATTDGGIIFKGSGGYDYGIWLQSNSFWGGIWNGAQKSVTDPNSISLNTWYFLTMTYDGSYVRFYRNGSLAGTPVAATGNITNTATTVDIGRAASNGWYFNGTIDDVRIYNYARTQSQVAWDYNRGKPIGWWKFDECQGTTAYDASGNANNGTITIGATVPQSSAGNCSTVDTATAWYNGRTGKFNSALSLDGTDDYVDTISTTAFNFERTQAFSVGAWIKSNYSGSSAIVIASNMHATSLAGYEFFIDGNLAGKPLGFGLLNSGPTEIIYASDATGFNVLDNQWHYVQATYDGSSSLNGIKLYIDGVSKTTANGCCQTSITTSILSNTSLKIGQQGTSTPYWFPGSIDDVRVYNYALTPTQIKLLYNGDSAIRFGPATGSP